MVTSTRSTPERRGCFFATSFSSEGVLSVVCLRKDTRDASFARHSYQSSCQRGGNGSVGHTSEESHTRWYCTLTTKSEMVVGDQASRGAHVAARKRLIRSLFDSVPGSQALGRTGRQLPWCGGVCLFTRFWRTLNISCSSIFATNSDAGTGVCQAADQPSVARYRSLVKPPACTLSALKCRS